MSAEGEGEEAKLLRLLIGYVHVLLRMQTALGTAGKHPREMPEQDRFALEDSMLGEVIAAARNVNVAVLTEILQKPPKIQ